MLFEYWIEGFDGAGQFVAGVGFVAHGSITALEGTLICGRLGGSSYGRIPPWPYKLARIRP